MSTNYPTVSPLIAAGIRFPGRDLEPACDDLSPLTSRASCSASPNRSRPPNTARGDPRRSRRPDTMATPVRRARTSTNRTSLRDR